LQLHLLVGKANGSVYRYKLDTAYNKHFKLVDIIVPGFSTGYRSTVCVANIMGDNRPEILVGNFRGGIQLFSADTILYKFGTSVQNLAPPSGHIQVIPNPAQTQFTLVIGDYRPGTQLYIYDAMGHQIIQQEMTHKTALINVNAWSAGVYLVRVCHDGTCETAKVVKL
jgi:hypothetical protein